MLDWNLMVEFWDSEELQGKSLESNNMWEDNENLFVLKNGHFWLQRRHTAFSVSSAPASALKPSNKFNFQEKCRD